MKDETVLEIHDLRAVYRSPRGVVRAVDGVSLDLRRGETLALAGESGCGKSTLGLAILRLLEGLNGRVEGGRILYREEDLVRASPRRMRGLRGRHIAMIFQDPQTSLNPVLSVGDQIVEHMRVHLRIRGREAESRALSLMQQLGIPLAQQRLEEYPHQFSGGMKQRVMIAIAVACEPDVLIADEPTSALDVTTKVQIVALFRRLRQERSLSLLLITHDLGVVAQLADRVAVMYAGRLAELGTTAEVFDTHQHPYTQGLLLCLPDASAGKVEPIPGTVPDLMDTGDYCPFHPRCPYGMDVCLQKRPPEFVTAPGHRVACYRYSRYPVFRAF